MPTSSLSLQDVLTGRGVNASGLLSLYNILLLHSPAEQEGEVSHSGGGEKKRSLGHHFFETRRGGRKGGRERGWRERGRNPKSVDCSSSSLRLTPPPAFLAKEERGRGVRVCTASYYSSSSPSSTPTTAPLDGSLSLAKKSSILSALHLSGGRKSSRSSFETTPSLRMRRRTTPGEVSV